ncbi:hypothetical protein KAR91_06490, partial [Candidatus Pacearchaeota archaeon]|nr:hypothetical protein [Candidatus Pacearchaeota archaeon]
GTNATNRTPVSLDRTSIGRRGTSSPIKYMSGMIAEAAIWDLSNWPGATSGDKADNFEKILPSLVKGCSPLFFPLGLKAYWPLIRSLNDIVGGFNLTDINGTIAADHPTIIYPSSVPAGIFVAGEAPPAGIPIFRRRRECA